MARQGPLRPGRVFTPDGGTTRAIMGPVRPGTDEGEFRRTGRSVPMSGGGSSSGSNRSRAEAERLAAAKRAAEIKAEAEAKAKAETAARIAAAKTQAEKTRLARQFVENKKAMVERARILQYRSNLIKEGVREQTSKSRDSKTGASLVVSQWRDKQGNRVQRIVNKSTDTTTYASFKRIGGRVQKTGGVTVGSIQRVANVKMIVGKPDKRLVIFPNGRRAIIDATGTTVVGKNFAGERYVFDKGRITFIGDAPKKDAVMTGEVTKVKRLPIKDYIKAKTVIPLSVIKADVSASSQALKKQWESQLSRDRSVLLSSASNIDRLAALQRKKNLTAEERKEKERLKKLVAENYRKASNYVGMSVGVSLINLGFGSVDLVRAIREDPKVILSLPASVIAGVKEDFGRASSSGLDATAVAFEYITLSALLGGAGKVTKAGLKGLGRLGLKSSRYASRAAIRAAKVAGKSRLVKAAKKTKIVRKVRKVRKVVRVKQTKAISKFKSNVDYSKQLKAAKNIRRAQRKKGIRTLSIGNDDYIKAVAYMEGFADDLGRVRAKQFLKKWKASGKKLGLGQEEEFIRRVVRYTRSQLDEMADFRRLKSAAKLNKPFQIQLRKVGKLATAKDLYRKLSVRVKKIPVVRRMDSTIKAITRKTKAVGRKVSPKRIKAKVKRARAVRAGRKQFRQTNRYRMEKARKPRKVTLEQLQRSRSINDARRLVDEVWDEVARRGKVDITSLQYRQLKNTIKKRVSNAIRRGDKAEIANFKRNIKSILDDLNKKQNQPSIKVYEKGKSPKRIRTIKDFKPETPKGKYVEVKKGGLIQLQEVKQVQKQVAKQVQRQVQKQQVYVIQAVAPKTVNLSPMLRYLTYSLSAQAVRSMLRSKQSFGAKPTTAQLFKVLQDSKQDFKTAQDVAQSTKQGFNVASAIAQDVLSKQRTSPKLRTVQKTVQKKKALRIRRAKKKNTRTLAKKVMAYGFVVRKRGKAVKLNIPPLTLADAWNIGAYRLDHDLQRTGKLMPLGMTKEVAIIPKSVRGYYAKHKKKFRRFRQKKGKRFTLERVIIEKKKYVGDLRSEQVALRKAARGKRKVVKKRTPVKKKVVRRKAVRMTPARRRVMLRNLAKARAAKKKPIKRKAVKKKVVKKKAVKKSIKRKTPVKRKRRKKKAPSFPTM